MFMKTTQQMKKELNRLADIVHDKSKTEDERGDAEIAWTELIGIFRDTNKEVLKKRTQMTLKEECLQELVQDGYMSEEEVQTERFKGFTWGLLLAAFIQLMVLL